MCTHEQSTNFDCGSQGWMSANQQVVDHGGDTMEMRCEKTRRTWSGNPSGHMLLLQTRCACMAEPCRGKLQWMEFSSIVMTGALSEELINPNPHNAKLLGYSLLKSLRLCVDCDCLTIICGGS